MHQTGTQPRVDWNRQDHKPSLASLQRLRQTIPAAPLLAAMQQWRGRGRHDHPVDVLWHVLIMQIARGHRSIEAGLADLHANSDLRQLIGLGSPAKIPSAWQMAAFLNVLGQPLHAHNLRIVFDLMVTRLGRGMANLGSATASAATRLNASGSPHLKDADASPGDDYEAYGLPMASIGRQTCLNTAGRISDIVEWFGYKLHLLVDVSHEVALAYQVTATKADDEQVRTQLLDQARANLPDRRILSLGFDPPAHESLDATSTATARVSARLRACIGDDGGCVKGAARCSALLGAIMIVHLGSATLLASGPNAADARN
jgi:hypothetical protein